MPDLPKDTQARQDAMSAVDLTLSEVARSLGCSVYTVWSVVHGTAPHDTALRRRVRSHIAGHCQRTVAELWPDATPQEAA